MKKNCIGGSSKVWLYLQGIYHDCIQLQERTKKGNYKQLYFKELKHGRKEVGQKGKDIIISLRKKYYSVEDIKIALDSKGFNISEKSIYNIIRGQGFARLPRRQKLTKKSLEPISIKADKTVALSFVPESFKSASAGILCLLPYIKKYGISDLIQSSCFPETTQVSKLSSILAFIALKSSNVRRYTADDLWCMDRGLGLFAGLNVLPKEHGSLLIRTGLPRK
ncbi:MAG: hypothetical protein J7L95_06195 [Prolixibacteraceae bacterium]|nr:hypothetical protein [Prolixibacteraceae bacterium]